SILQEIAIYNTNNGYTGTNAVSMGEQWFPSGGNNEWEYWHRVFDNQISNANIISVMNTNKIVVIKSCYPSSEIVGRGQPSDTLNYPLKTIYNYKWHWRKIIEVMAARPQNFFAIWTNAPHVQGNTNSTSALLAKEFCTWAKDTLAMGLDPVMGAFPANVYVFDYFSKLSGANGYLLPQYAVSNSDSHPNSLATELVAPQFVSEIFDAAIAYEQGGATLNVAPASQSVSATAGSASFTVNSSASWTAQSSASWCTVTPSGTGNGSITADYTANTSSTPRTASITISASGANTQTVTVIQAGVAAALAVSPSTQSVTATAGNTSFSVTSNVNWTATSNAGWCTVTPSGSGNGSVIANYSANTNTSSRTATITISASGVSNQTVTVIQAGVAAALAVSPSTQSVTATAGNTSFSVTSNVNWTAMSNAGWCTVTSSGSGNATLTANYTENTATISRTATITISASGVTNQTVTVIQAAAAAALAVSPLNQNVAAPSGSTSFTVSSNLNWTAQSNAGWCTVTPSGIGNGTINANFTANTSTSSRTATITVAATGVSNHTVTVTQAGTSSALSVNPSTQSVSALSGNTSFSVTSNTAWIAQSNASWCTVTSSGTGNGTINAYYTENLSTNSRTATITISASGMTDQTVSVTQAGAAVILAVSPPSHNVTSSAGTTDFSVVSNTGWNAVSNAGWCTVTPSGNGSGAITANYEENTETSSRTATITVSSSGIVDQLVTVYQIGTASALAVAPLNQNVSSETGSTSFEVTSNTSWTAQSDASWCMVTSSGNGNGFILADYSENTEIDLRTATITLSAAGLPDQIVTVSQAGSIVTLAATPSNQNVPASSGSVNFTISSNSDWSAQSNAGWCSVTLSGSGNGVLTADYTTNTSVIGRTASITVSATGAQDQIITVSQFGAASQLAVSPPSQQVSYLAGNTSFSVSSNTNWTVQSDENWCTATPSGSGNGEIIAVYQQNHTIYDRTANLKVMVEGLSPQFVTVEQLGVETGVNTTEIGKFRIYPNPSSGAFKLVYQNPQNGTTKVEVRDMPGRTVYSKEFRGNISEKIHLQKEGKGIFIVTIYSGNEIHNTKLIIQ
ncbi:MAG: hypothetical protein CVU14_03400, partial [Bacteroidetes bacterium HGW-Bacteroidetes-9]